MNVLRKKINTSPVASSGQGQSGDKLSVSVAEQHKKDTC